MIHTVQIEAKDYGDTAANFDALERTLPDPTEDLGVTLGGDDEKGYLSTTFVLDAQDAYDAYEQAMMLWSEAWRESFEDQGMPSQLVIRAKPGGEITGEVAREAAELTEEEEIDAELAEISGE